MQIVICAIWGDMAVEDTFILKDKVQKNWDCLSGTNSATIFKYITDSWRIYTLRKKC